MARTIAARERSIPIPGTPVSLCVVSPRSVSDGPGHDLKDSPRRGSGGHGHEHSMETCPIFCQEIVEATEKSDGQEALLCEGTCQKWLHRWCAGVHKENYEALAASDKPFFCPSCCLAEHRQLRPRLVI